ncbi:MAG: DHHW family protein [Clostridiales bacterium]|nr:DHHW family protein [Clostridiales bacterium]
MSKKFLLGLLAALSLSLIMPLCIYADNPEAIYVNGNIVKPFPSVIVEDNRTFASIRQFADIFGASVEWDENEEKITSTLGDMTVRFQIGSREMIKYGQPIDMGAACRYYDGSAMVPIRAIGDAYGYPVTWNEKHRAIFLGEELNLDKNPMDGTVVTDEFRYNNYIGEYGGVSVFSNGNDNFGMELLSINDYWSNIYADNVAEIARRLPDVNVYNIAAPTAQEFYASNARRADQTGAISKIYERLMSYELPNLRPVNVVQTLSDHAAEKIYFNTDHHWTQRGAYYAWREFSRINPDINDAAPLESYEVQNIYGYCGSLCSFSAGTYGSTLLRQNADMLQLFFPKAEYQGASYRDPYMSSYIQSMKAIYPPARSYSCFIEGDYPLEVYKTNVNNGRKICIIKESFGDAFSTWALDSYEEVYIVDYRMFNGGTYGGFGTSGTKFSITDFYDFVKFDDLVIISYPVSISASSHVNLLGKM